MFIVYTASYNSNPYATGNGFEPKGFWYGLHDHYSPSFSVWMVPNTCAIDD